MPPLKKFNPAAYKPTTQVLRMVVRGRAGTRKTTFAASMAEAGLGPILFLDTERKVTNVRNWQTRFAETLTLTDAEAVEGAVDWLITDPDARALNLAGVIVDSWNGYFQLKLDEAIKARIAETGTPNASLAAEQSQRLTVECGANVLHPLCVKF